MKGPAILLALTLVGCASSSGVYEVSPGTYAVTSTAFTSLGGSATATGSALKKAQATCVAKGKRMELVNQNNNANIASGSAQVTFRCIR